MSKIFIGIDNGISGSVGIIYPNNTHAFMETPTIKCLSYTKEPQHIHRIDWMYLNNILAYAKQQYPCVVLIERPMVNPRAFKATQSALRSLEATIIVLEMVGIEYYFVDSKEWQKEFLSSAVIGAKELKKASMEVGLKLFPSNGSIIRKHGDADGLLLALHCKNKYEKL